MAWVLKNADIIAALPILADYYEKADGGSTTTLTCKRLTSLDDRIDWCYYWLCQW